MATASRIEHVPEYRTLERVPSRARTAVVVVPPSRRPWRSASRLAQGGASMTTLRWAFAFYGGFFFIPVGTVVSSWFGS